MKQHGLIYPMVTMVILTFVVLIALFRNRAQSVSKGEVSASYFKTYRGEVEPDSSVKLSQHFANIFEAPTLFYVACLAAMIVGETAMAFQFLAWAYVILRALHAHVHTGSNKLKQRIGAYFSSWVVLLLMWAYLAISTTMSN